MPGYIESGLKSLIRRVPAHRSGRRINEAENVMSAEAHGATVLQDSRLPDALVVHVCLRLAAAWCRCH